MSDYAEDAAENLEFFKAAILEPALSLRVDYRRDEFDRIVSDLGVIEAANWAALGARIRYFDGKDAQSLVSSSEWIFDAWAGLQKRGMTSSEGNLEEIVKITEAGEYFINESYFARFEKMGRDAGKLFHDAFQNFLLLTAENLFDDASRYFVSSISWASDEEWNARKEGRVSRDQSPQQIASGFANVWRYWDEIGPWQDPQVRLGVASPVAEFTRLVQPILSRRFNLGNEGIVDRYFELAGAFVNRARDDSPEWLDSRSTIFSQLRRMIQFVGGADLRERREHLWNLFTKARTEAVSSRGRVIRDADSAAP